MSLPHPLSYVSLPRKQMEIEICSRKLVGSALWINTLKRVRKGVLGRGKVELWWFVISATVNGMESSGLSNIEARSPGLHAHISGNHRTEAAAAGGVWPWSKQLFQSKGKFWEVTQLWGINDRHLGIWANDPQSRWGGSGQHTAAPSLPAELTESCCSSKP